MMQVHDTIDRVVDINPHKQGKFLAGTGQQIVAPEQLRDAPPDVVLLMNPIYRDEVAAQLSDLKRSPQLISA